MRRIIAVVDNDISYASRLADFFNSHDAGGLKTVAFSGPEALKKVSTHDAVQVLIASEENLALIRGRELAEVTLILSEDGFKAEESDRPAVFKYARADRILHRVLEQYSLCSGGHLGRVGSCEGRIIGIYSPVGSCGKTELAITLGLLLAEKEKTLLITLDEFGGIFRRMVPEAENDLSDDIYSFEKGQYSWSRLSGTVYPFGNLEFIPPVRYADDLSELPSSRMCELLQKIAAESGYGNLILDIGSYGSRAPEIFDICSLLYMPVPDDPLRSEKIREFEERMNEAGHKDITERIIKLKLPMDFSCGSLKCEPENYLRTCMSDTVRQLIKEGIEDGEDR